MQCACAILSYVACPAYNIFPHLINSTAFKKKIIEYKMCVCRVSLRLLSEIFFILRIERDMIKNIRWSSCNSIFYSSPISLTLEFFQQIFKKFSNIIFPENPSSGSRVVPCARTDRRTDITKLIVAFLNFANAPKIARLSGRQAPCSCTSDVSGNDTEISTWKAAWGDLM